MSNFWKELDGPIKVLAPMAGYTDASFRLLCREFGADVTISELVSADAIAYGKFTVQSSQFAVGGKLLTFNKVVGNKNQSTAELLSFFEEERPFVVQLFGKNPENFAKATQWISENLKPDGIDINMGCPARKVVGSDHGAALIKDPALAAEIVWAVKSNTNLPVSVKTRLGWDDSSTILEFAPVLKEAGLPAGQAGIDAIIVHGRTYKQGFSGEAEWANIYKVKELLPDLIVIGNGGVKTVESLKLKVKNLDGVAIGQAAFGKPWLFSGKELSKKELKDLITRHAGLVYATKGEYGLVEFRKHLLKYLTSFPGAKRLRELAVSAENLADVEEILSQI